MGRGGGWSVDGAKVDEEVGGMMNDGRNECWGGEERISMGGGNRGGRVVNRERRSWDEGMSRGMPLNPMTTNRKRGVEGGVKMDGGYEYDYDAECGGYRGSYSRYGGGSDNCVLGLDPASPQAKRQR